MSLIFARMTNFRRRHPRLAQAIVWSIPALVVGTLLRLALLSYSPYAYWGADSDSYFSFAYRFLTEGEISLYAKRRYLYPIFLLPVSALPGSPLRWTALIQHLMGVLTLIPTAYIVRKVFPFWKLLIVPLTVLCAGLPVTLWYEHELLGEAVFFCGIVWAIAAWIAWVGASTTERSRRLWWLVVGCLLLLTWTKPSGRFLWPGVGVGLCITFSWRKLAWRHFAALGGVAAISFTTGQDSQSAWLLYNSAFPLTRIEGARHAEYKAQIADLVAEARQHIDAWHALDSELSKAFLKNPDRFEGRPLWAALRKDSTAQARLYRDLAIEGIAARPDLMLYISLQRMVASANLEEFKERRFAADYFADRFEKRYRPEDPETRKLLRFLFALPADYEFPPYEEFRRRLSPAPESAAAEWLTRFVVACQEWTPLVIPPNDLPPRERSFRLFRPTFLGIWVALGAILSLILHTRTLGVWTLIGATYLVGVFILGSENPRFFAAMWPLVILLTAVPIDALLCFVRTRRAATHASPQFS